MVKRKGLRIIFIVMRYDFITFFFKRVVNAQKGVDFYINYSTSLRVVLTKVSSLVLLSFVLSFPLSMMTSSKTSPNSINSLLIYNIPSIFLKFCRSIRVSYTEMYRLPCVYWLRNSSKDYIRRGSPLLYTLGSDSSVVVSVDSVPTCIN